ncbi:MAG: preprotein translocase subunit SecY [Candidatus Hadarchaeales archaeon]
MNQEAKPKSRLYVFKPVLRFLPEVEVPKRHVSFREKFLWSALALLLFLVMTQIPLYGVEKPIQSFFGALRYVLASHAGSLVELGIGPIVTAGIIMQLLVGAKLIGLDLREREDRALFTGVQKLFAIFMAIFQGGALVMGGWYTRGGNPLPLETKMLVLGQLVLGAVVVMYLDELVSKYGFGSGIGLFIVGGVATEVIWQALSPFTYGGELIGALPFFFSTLLSGGPLSEAFTRGGANMLGVIATVGVFLVAVYVESMRVEIPLAYGRFGGIRGRYPLKFMYTSVIPVILAMAVFANLRLLTYFLPRLRFMDPYLNAPRGLTEVLGDPMRTLIYFLLLVSLCVAFSVLWVSLAGMGPREVAESLDEAGFLIPGFRRDVRVMEQFLSRYIGGLTILSGLVIGSLSALADFLGALGSGTGILLAVGITYSLYEEIARERVSEMFPALRRLLGE